MCKALCLIKTGYYRFVRNLDKPDSDSVLSAMMQLILDEYPVNDNYVVDRMKIALVNNGITAGRQRITHIMRENDWIHERQRRPKGITEATTEMQEQENLIKQDLFGDYGFPASHSEKTRYTVSRNGGRSSRNMPPDIPPRGG